MKRKTWYIVAIVVFVLLGALCIRLLLLETTLKYGLILLAALALAFLIWKAFIKSGQDELRESEKHGKELEGQVEDLKRRLDEMSRSKLNVTGISPILHLSVLELDTSFTRSYIREDKKKKLSFNGALRTDIRAQYGVKLEDVKFKYDEATKTLYLAQFQPGLLSFSKRQMTWDIARSFRERDFFGWIELPPVDDEEAEAFTKQMKEEIRAEVEREIDNRRIEEFEWLSPMITRQVTDVLKLALNKPDATVVILPEPTAEQIEGGDGTSLTQATPSLEEQGFIDFGDFYHQIEE